MKITSLVQHRVVGYCKKKYPTLNAHFFAKPQIFVWSSCGLLRKGNGFYQRFVFVEFFNLPTRTINSPLFLCKVFRLCSGSCFFLIALFLFSGLFISI